MYHSSTLYQHGYPVSSGAPFGGKEADENWGIAEGESHPEDMLSLVPQWTKYNRVLARRGVQMAAPRQPMQTLADDPTSSWNTNQAGPRPWGEGDSVVAGLHRANGRR